MRRLQITRFTSRFDGFLHTEASILPSTLEHLRVAFTTMATLMRLPATKLHEGPILRKQELQGLGKDCVFIGFQDMQRII
jgi:hypothetical protein